MKTIFGFVLVDGNWWKLCHKLKSWIVFAHMSQSQVLKAPELRFGLHLSIDLSGIAYFERDASNTLLLASLKGRADFVNAALQRVWCAGGTSTATR